jgi:hypothetical protein
VAGAANEEGLAEVPVSDPVRLLNDRPSSGAIRTQIARPSTRGPGCKMRKRFARFVISPVGERFSEDSVRSRAPTRSTKLSQFGPGRQHRRAV